MSPAGYLRLWFHLAGTSLIRALEYRVNFMGRITVELIWIATQIVFFISVFSKAPDLANWSFHEIVFFIATLYLVDGIYMLVSYDNMNSFGQMLRHGLFDAYLLRPVSSLFLACFRSVNAIACINISIGIGLALWAALWGGLNLSILQWCTWIVYFLCGAYMVILLSIVICSIAFWITQTGSLQWGFFELYRLSFRPDNLYSGWVRRILLSVFPAAFFISVPVQLALHKIQGWQWYAWPFCFATLMTLLARFIWTRGIRRYEGAMG